jgi:hypothetical protein
MPSDLKTIEQSQNLIKPQKNNPKKTTPRGLEQPYSFMTGFRPFTVKANRQLKWQDIHPAKASILE